ncbi:rod shape-determining protein MreD [Rhodobacteraceae bacterium CCMM004]|nr:rod shape-determining protein MreD [Rhodobacteraceae bacterium CCMM004]
MADPVTSANWVYRGLFAASALAVIFVQILPFRIGDPSVPGPDLLPLLAFAWVLRRPDYVPVWLVALTMLFADLMLMRPPGLWSALVVLGVEFLRSRVGLSRGLPVLVEWAMVALVLAGITALHAVILAVVMVEQPTVAQTALHALTTIVAYPAVVLLSAAIYGVRKTAPGEVDALGHRL